MAIVKMNKFTLLAFESQKAELLEKLQGFSEVEFVNLQDDELINNDEVLCELAKDSNDSDYVGCEDELSMAKGTLNYLKNFVPQKSMLKALKEGKRELTFSQLKETVLNTDWKSICAKVKAKEDEISALQHEMSKLNNDIEILRSWEAFDAPFAELVEMKSPYFMGSLPKQYEETLASELGDFYYEVVSKDNDDLYLFLVCDKSEEEEVSEKLRGFGFSQFKTDLEETPIKIIHDNMDNVEKLNSKVFFIKEELAAFDEDAKTLELVCEYYGNKVIRKEAINNFLTTKNVVVIQGWLPESEKEELEKVVNSVVGNEYNISFQEVAEEEYDIVPVKLKNNEFNEVFEDVTNMFSVPKYNEIDPTPFVAPFYALFFGMMAADIGYGILMLIATTVALKVFKFDEGTKKFVRFFRYLSFPIIGFGLAYGAFFGDVFFDKLPRIVDPNTDIMTVLIISVVFGAIHIFFGLGIKAYMLIKAGKPKDAFYDVGAWVITLVSIGLVLGGNMMGLPPIGKKIAMVAMIAGMVIIVLTGGREEKTRGAQLGQGAYALYGITGYIGDLVSYSRLMALGLSGGSLAGAFNLIAGMMSGFSAILFVPLIFIFGHIFNLALGLLGAYVHTCRLEYVEFFGKFYEGGGRAFTPFKSKNEYINLKRD